MPTHTHTYSIDWRDKLLAMLVQIKQLLQHLLSEIICAADNALILLLCKGGEQCMVLAQTQITVFCYLVSIALEACSL